MPLPNLHGTAVVLADKGVLITGPSGSGKTTLALALIEAGRQRRRFARLVADDQLLVDTSFGVLTVCAPPPIFGMVEIRGLGPRPAAAENRAVIDLAIDLVDASRAPRFQEPSRQTVAGATVSTLTLRHRDARANVDAILSQLDV